MISISLLNNEVPQLIAYILGIAYVIAVIYSIKYSFRPGLCKPIAITACVILGCLGVICTDLILIAFGAINILFIIGGLINMFSFSDGYSIGGWCKGDEIGE